MRAAISILAVAGAVVALPQDQYVTQISDGQIQAPTGPPAYSTPAESVPAPVSSAAPVESAPPAYSAPQESVPAPVGSSEYTAPPAYTSAPPAYSSAAPIPGTGGPVPSYPAGNGTVVAPTGGYGGPAGTGAVPTKSQTAGGYGGASSSPVSGESGSAPAASATGNAASGLTAPIGALMAGLLAFLA